jgi:hypothetical protein
MEYRNHPLARPFYSQAQPQLGTGSLVQIEHFFKPAIHPHRLPLSRLVCPAQAELSAGAPKALAEVS